MVLLILNSEKKLDVIEMNNAIYRVSIDSAWSW